MKLVKRLRIGINAQVDHEAGGIQTVLRELAALAQLEGPEEFIFISPWDGLERLRELLGPQAQIVSGPAPEVDTRPSKAELFKQALGPFRTVARDLKRSILPGGPHVQTATASPSQTFYESIGCDVIHFPFQWYEHCDIPTVYNPHDLQHRSFSEFFTPSEYDWREATFSKACASSQAVVVASEAVKTDLLQAYDLSPEKIQVIPWAPPPRLQEIPGREESQAFLADEYGLHDQPFVLYPAMTWEHKNHLRLLEALALLRDNNRLTVRLVCTGARKDFWPVIERRITDLNLNNQVNFLGMVSYETLSKLYRSAQFVVIPTLFEAASAPLFEAWQHEAPVACSAVTSLPEQAADAALLFDPLSIREIADAVALLSKCPDLRDDLKRRGTRRLDDFSLEHTVKSYRAVYRRAAGSCLNEEDRWLLTGDWWQPPPSTGAEGWAH